MRHNSEVMHVEKNECNNVVGDLLDINGKTKDNLNTRKDLEKMRIKNPLHPIRSGDVNIILLTTCVNL